MQPAAEIAVVAAPDAPAGGADPTRRHALRFPDGRTRFPGLARDEAEDLGPAIGAEGPARWDRLLVEVALPVVLSDGAGPHLLDDAGRLTLALADHPRLAPARVAMGAPAPAHRIGVVRPTGVRRLWEWLADAEVEPARRVDALEALDGVADAVGLERWQRRERAMSHAGPA